MRTCTSCGALSAGESARFCVDCGAGLDTGCAACGAEVPGGSRFCPGCGAPQAGGTAAAPNDATAAMPVASRRITSVLFGDLVSFTAYSESRDQEEVRELLSAYFEECSRIVARYGGTLEKFIGDAVMAVWGVPVANEDDAERAVRAGLELVNRIDAMGADLHVPDLAMRVGIVTGEVAVTIGATQQGMVAGDAVNTAARVQAAAAAGQVWVDETTRLLTTSAIAYVDVGSHRMKGKADPVPLWAVRAVVANVGGAQRADGLEAPLVGRDREMRLVKEIFHAAEESGRPSLLVIDGEAGVGKTRIAWEFEKYADGLSTTARWHSGRCLSYGEGVAYFALAEAIRGRLQLTHGADPASDDDVEPSELLESGLERYVPDPDERGWLRPRLGALLGTGAVGTFPREDLFAAWTAFLRRVGEEHPIVLVIDDAQYADEGLLRFLDYLLGVGDFPCFVMLLARPQLLTENPGLATNRRVTVLHLDTLSARDMAVLLDGLVVGLPDALREALVARAEGIPLYAVETVRSLIDRDLVVPRGGQYVLGDADLDLDRIGAPASLQALIAARLDALPPDQRRVLDQASVLGTSFERRSIEHLCADVDNLDAVIGSLVRVQLLRQESNRFSAEAGHYQFVQGAVRQVAYSTISRRDRRARHLAVAALLEGEEEDAAEAAAVIAQHYLEAIEAIPDADDATELNARAVQHLERAASRAAALGAPAEAAGHLRVALARAEDPTLSASIEADLAQYLNRSGANEEALRHAEQARDKLDRLGEPLRAAAAVCSIAQAMNTLRLDGDAVVAMIDERLAALHGVESATPVLLELARRKGGTLLRQGADMRENAELQARLADRLGDPSEMSDAHMGLALYYVAVGPPSIARLLLGSAARFAREAHDSMQLTRVLVNLSAHLTQDDTAEAIEVGNEAVQSARMTGDPQWLTYAVLNWLVAEFAGGNWDAIEAEHASGPGDEISQGYVSSLVASIRRARDQDLGVDLTSPGGTDLIATVLGLVLAAFAAAERGDPDAGRLAVAAMKAEFELTSVYDDFSVLFLLMTDLVRDLGDRGALDELLAVPSTRAENLPPTGVRAVDARLRGLLAIDDGAEPAEIESLLRLAIAEADAWNARPLLARTRAELGVWLRGQGRESEGDALVAEARPELEGLGATRWLRQLDAALAGMPA